MNKATEAIVAAARMLAAKSRTLDDLIVEAPTMPLGWFCELPPRAASGLPLAPHAKEVFWLLAGASYQIAVGLDDPAPVAGSRFGQFLVAPNWDLIRPANGFDFLFAWQIDPEYFALANAASRLLALTREYAIRHVGVQLFNGIDIEERDAARAEMHVQRERALLDYFLVNGASPPMVREMFPPELVNGTRVVFRPGRVPGIDLKTAQRLYNVWDELCREMPIERERFVALHRQFPDYTLGALYGAINNL